MIESQTFAARSENLNQANKLVRSYATLIEALDRHRGKGRQQHVTVKHVHIHRGHERRTPMRRSNWSGRPCQGLVTATPYGVPVGS